MAHFNFNRGTQRDLSTLVSVFGADAANINSLGETNPLKTSGSGNPTTTLTSFSVSEMLQGQATYRPQGYAMDAFNQSLSSDLGYLIRTEGGENQLLAGRQGLLAQDVLRRQGFDDGIFSAESGIVGHDRFDNVAAAGPISSGASGTRPTATGNVSTDPNAIIPEAIQAIRTDKGKPFAEGSPYRWVLHTMECNPSIGQDALLATVRTHDYPPHFWVDLPNQVIIQTISTDMAAEALVYGDEHHTIQVEIAGWAAETQTYPEEWWVWLRDTLLVPVANHHNIDLENHPAFYGQDAGFILASESSQARMTEEDWLGFNGVCGHQHVPGNDHWDPGSLPIQIIAAGSTTSPTSRPNTAF